MTPLKSLESALRYIAEAVTHEDCEKKLAMLNQQKSWWGAISSWFSSQPVRQTNLRMIELAFQKQVQELIHSLAKFELYLKKSCEKNIVAKDFDDGRLFITRFYSAVHPFLMLLQRFHKGNLSPLEAKNMQDIFRSLKNDVDCPNPFDLPQKKLLCRYKAMIALEGLYQGPLPYSTLKKIARNYKDLWQGTKEEAYYDEKIRNIMQRIDQKSYTDKKIALVIHGFRAFVEHVNDCHHVEGTSKASLDGLELAFYMVGKDYAPKKHHWLGEFDPQQIKWRKALKEGTVLNLNGKILVLGKQLKKKQQLYEKREDKNLIFECHEKEDQLVMVPQNHAMLHVISLFRNTALPLFEIIEIESKGRFALIERLYPLKATEENFLSILQQFDAVTKDNKQPSTLDKELAKLNCKGEFRSISKGEMISLNRPLLEELVLVLVQNDPKRYRDFVRKSVTMDKLHQFCIDLIFIAIGPDKWMNVDSACRRKAISFPDDCRVFHGVVIQFRNDVFKVLLKDYEADFLEKHEQEIFQSILDCYVNLDACGQFTLEAQNIVCEIFKKKIAK